MSHIAYLSAITLYCCCTFYAGTYWNSCILFALLKLRILFVISATIYIHTYVYTFKCAFIFTGIPMQFVPDNHFALTKIHTYMVHCSLIFVVALFFRYFCNAKNAKLLVYPTIIWFCLLIATASIATHTQSVLKRVLTPNKESLKIVLPLREHTLQCTWKNCAHNQSFNPLRIVHACNTQSKMFVPTAHKTPLCMYVCI